MPPAAPPSGGGSGHDGGNKNPPPPPPSDYPASGSASGSGSGGNQRPSHPPHDSGSTSSSGPVGRPPSPTLVFARGVGVAATKNEFSSRAIPGKEYNREHTNEKIPDDVARTFMGERYRAYELKEDFIFYRAGNRYKATGEYYSFERPASEMQSRIDKAIKDVWPTGDTSVVEKGYAIKIPAGKTVYVGLAAPQGGTFLGGTTQIYIPEEITKNAEVCYNYDLEGELVWNTIARKR